MNKINTLVNGNISWKNYRSKVIFKMTGVWVQVKSWRVLALWTVEEIRKMFYNPRQKQSISAMTCLTFIIILICLLLGHFLANIYILLLPQSTSRSPPCLFFFFQNWPKVQSNNVTGYFRIQSLINPNPYANNLNNGT